MFPHLPPDRRAPAVKICGITQEQQAHEIIALGADALGLNFWPQSKRYLPLDKAGWLTSLSKQTTLVAVLVNPEPDLLQILTDKRLVHIIQLHGDEPPELVRHLQNQGANVIKALAVRDADSLQKIGDYSCDTILLDAYNPGLYGGTGETFPWELATLAKNQFPNKNIILSGGLNADNVQKAVNQTQVMAVDVASGVESSPGVKDLHLVERFIQEAKSHRLI